jgi:hypothetical protein
MPTAPRRSPRRSWPLVAASLLVLGIGTARSGGAQESRAVRERLGTVDSTQTLAIRTRDGSTFIGRLLDRDSAAVRLTTEAGVVTVRVATIVRVDVIGASDVRNGVYWFPSPNATRLLFAPTGRMLERGDGYVSDYELFFPGVAYGVTDRVTIGGGLSVFPGIGLDEQILYFTPKIGLVRGEKVNVAVGALVATFPEFDDDKSTSFGIVYGVGTFGGPNGSVTAGVGYGYTNGGLADRPAILLGGEARVSRRVALITENYAVPGVDGVLLSGGLRFFGEQLAVDLAVVAPVGGTDTVGIPFVGFVFNF